MLWRIGTGAALLAAAVFLMTSSEPQSIYRTPETRARLEAIYAEKLAAWPVAHESLVLNTRLGQVHVIVAGAEEAPPVLLLHASGVASWSWGPNAAALARAHRLYAVDLVGDAGRSACADPRVRIRSGADQAAHYVEVMDRLGLDRVPVIGASEGGFIASNLALHRPDRVERLILLGPMGYSGALGAVVRIMLAQLYPLEAVQRATFRWALSDDPALLAEYGEWFPLVMSGTRPLKVAPLPFSAEERQAIGVPALFVFGTRDRLVGDPDRARARVQDIANVEVRIVEAGHLMAAERPDLVNPILLDALGGD